MDLELLAGKRALGCATPEDHIAWAERLLAEGTDMDDVQILASLGLDRRPDAQEVEGHFRRSLRALGLELPARQLALLTYASRVCRQIITGELPPEDGLRQLETLHAEGRDEPLFGIWGELAEDIDLLTGGDAPFFNSGLERTNTGDFIKRVARQYLRLQEADLPGDFLRRSLCTECGHTGRERPHRSEIRWLPASIFRLLFRRAPDTIGVCERCGAARLLPMHDFATRERYLAQTTGSTMTTTRN